MVMFIKIQNWLMKPKVWSFVCFVSSIVGLLCYALSPTFNRLFGKWTWWKILIYLVFSFTICFGVLFAKSWQRSTSARVEAHMAFLILLITSVYSFFFDKKVKGKLDAYGLFSCVAFAIMSLTLSRQSHFGCEIDLLYFFSGVLIVQLMKINLWLVIVGGSFSYSLIILRSTLDPSSRYDGLQSRDDIVIEIGSLSHSQSQAQATSDLDSHQAIIVGTSNVHDTIITRDCSRSQNNCDNIVVQFKYCIKALKKEHKNLMDTVSKHVGEYLKTKFVNEDQILAREIELHADDNLMVDALPPGIINGLREAIRLMVSAELKVECCRVYRRCRRKFVRKSVSTLLQMVSELNAVEDVDHVMVEIQWWIKVLNVAVKIIFPNEKRFCDCVFEGSISNVDKYRVSLGNDARKFERILNFSMNLVHLTCGDKGQATIPGGGIHQITHRVFDYMNTLNWKDVSPLFLEMTRIMITELLETSLEAKSKIYNSPTLGYIFILNNWRFIEVAATRPGLKPIFGQDWFRKSTTKFQQNLELYLRSSWDKIVDILKVEDINELEPNVVAELTKTLHSFNEHFDNMCNVQSMWFVFDEQLREQILKSVENMLLPAYGTFLARFHDFLGKHAYEYIKYGMFEVQDRLNNNLFLVWESEEKK